MQRLVNHIVRKEKSKEKSSRSSKSGNGEEKQCTNQLVRLRQVELPKFLIIPIIMITGIDHIEACQSQQQEEVFRVKTQLN
jgi:hypothetical protein